MENPDKNNNNSDLKSSKPGLESTDSTEMFEHFHFVADKGQEPMRLDKYLVNKMMHTSRTRIQYAAQAGNILVNDVAM